MSQQNSSFPSESFCKLKFNESTKIATIYFSNYKRHNSINSTMQKQLVEILEKLTHLSCRLVVFTTEEGSKTWCSGMDLNRDNQLKLRRLLMGNQARNATRSEKATDTSQQLHSLIKSQFLNVFNTVAELPIPTMAFVRGPVLGGGMGLLLACDFIVLDRECLSSIFFQFAEVKRGLVPALISLFIVPRIGISLSKRLMMSGERIYAEKACELGIAHEVVSQDEMYEKYTPLLAEEAAPNAVKLTKKLVHSYRMENTNQLNLVLDVFREMMLSEEAKYGTTCFINKQKPNWREFEARSRL